MTNPTLLFDAELLRPAIARGALVLTPNRRLASRIRIALAAGQAAAPAAPVFALSVWLQQLWQQLVLRGDPLAAGLWVLNSTQELALWEQAVRSGDMPLLRPGQAAEQAQSAYRTLALWRQLSLSSALRTECAAQPDSGMFIEWADRFALSCAKRQALAAAERDRRVVEAALQRRLQLPPIIVTVGFDDMPPLYRALLQCIDDCSELELPDRSQQALCIGYDTLEKQLQAAALWAQRQLQKNSTGPIAIVVPELNQQRALVERVLLDVLTPEHVLPQQPRRLPLLNFSAGDALAQMPLIRCALQLLELTAHEIERETLLQLVGAPFHVIGADCDALTMFIERICALRTSKLRAAQLRQCAEAVAQHYPQWPLATLLQQLAEHVRRERLRAAKYSARQWAEIFSQLLTTFGWPGARTLDSIEYQQHAHWQQTLIEFARFDQIAGPLDCNAALQRLRTLLQAQVFQPQTADTPLQVLGVLEAAGLQFHSLWLCDMGDDRWPAAAAPHPLLPRDLQRRLRMPRCDAEREFDIAARLTNSLLASAQNIVVSYQNQREEVARQPSPLFKTLPKINSRDLFGVDLPELLPALARRRQSHAQFHIEAFAPGRAPLIDTGETARGGSGLFKDQAACPFRAFAAHRLNARPLDEPVAGLDAAERGVILHSALEYVWRELNTQAALLALSSAQQDELIQRAAVNALRDFSAQQPHRIGLRFTQLEIVRLQRVLTGWLAIERERGEFSVHALEMRSQITFNELLLRMRVDRIDRLADGRFLIIDYKTKNANCSIHEWLGERPDEPQLPLYAAAFDSDDEALAGIAFAQVRLEKPQLIGVGADDLSQQGFSLPSHFSDGEVLQDWSDLQMRWRSVLAELAQQFIEGHAPVAPKTAATCDFCALDSVCRIHHENAADDIDARRENLQ
ncbi:MAG TPA: PD-(D/E)XK nuclease family protein [Spongiibacteraceae bacterium]